MVTRPVTQMTRAVSDLKTSLTQDPKWKIKINQNGSEPSRFSSFEKFELDKTHFIKSKQYFNQNLITVIFIFVHFLVN